MSDRDQSVDVTGLLLAISPHSSHCLLIIGWVPVWIKHYQAIGTNQIEATSTRLAAQHENKFRVLSNTKNTVFMVASQL